MQSKPNFFKKAQAVARKIPYGRVSSYGAIARYLGAAKSARTVGWAMNASKTDASVPAHRVVSSKGILTGKNHFDGTNLMQQLLENEGVLIDNYQITNFKEIFWDPNLELRIIKKQ
jgi:methylated-DNA-protein-cysteine methyltransferase-like protein